MKHLGSNYACALPGTNGFLGLGNPGKMSFSDSIPKAAPALGNSSSQVKSPRCQIYLGLLSWETFSWGLRAIGAMEPKSAAGAEFTPCEQRVRRPKQTPLRSEQRNVDHGE